MNGCAGLLPFHDRGVGLDTKPKKEISRKYRVSSLSTVALFSVSLLLGTIGAGLANSTLQPQPQLVYAQEASWRYVMTLLIMMVIL
jgi:hypothetical protein